MISEGVKKRKEKKSTATDHSMNVEESYQQNGKADKPTDSLQTTLLQSLQVGDEEILTSILSTENEETIVNTVKGMPAESLQSFIAVLADRMTNNPNSTKSAVRWLKIVLKHNMQAIVSMPEAMNTLRHTLTFIRKKEQLIPTVCKIRGKLDLAIQRRKQQREVHKEQISLEGMKPLLVFNGGELEQTQQEVEEEPSEESAPDEIDDKLDEELDEEDLDEKMYQDAYENESLEDGDKADLYGEGDDDIDMDKELYGDGDDGEDEPSPPKKAPKGGKGKKGRK